MTMTKDSLYTFSTAMRVSDEDHRRARGRVALSSDMRARRFIFMSKTAILRAMRLRAGEIVRAKQSWSPFVHTGSYVFKRF